MLSNYKPHHPWPLATLAGAQGSCTPKTSLGQYVGYPYLEESTHILEAHTFWNLEDCSRDVLRLHISNAMRENNASYWRMERGHTKEASGFFQMGVYCGISTPQVWKLFLFFYCVHMTSLSSKYQLISPCLPFNLDLPFPEKIQYYLNKNKKAATTDAKDPCATSQFTVLCLHLEAPSGYLWRCQYVRNEQMDIGAWTTNMGCKFSLG